MSFREPTQMDHDKGPKMVVLMTKAGNWVCIMRTSRVKSGNEAKELVVQAEESVVRRPSRSEAGIGLSKIHITQR